MAIKIAMLAQNLRGAYLACELAGQGYEVTLINLKFNQENITRFDEPFPYLMNSKNSPLQKQFLQGVAYQKCPDGLTYWLDDGPLGLGTQFVQRSIKEKGLDKQTLNEWVSSSYGTSLQPDSGLADYEYSINGFNSAVSLNYSDYEIRTTLQDCSNAGVKIVNEPRDFKVNSVPNKIIVSIEDEMTEHTKLVCLLSSYELSQINLKVHDEVYGVEPLRPDWVWLCAEFNHNDCEPFKSTPDQFYMLVDKDDLWAYSNFVYIKKDKLKNKFQAWIRWPYNEVKNVDYLNNEFVMLKSCIEKKIQGLDISAFKIENDVLGPNFFTPAYLYNAEELRKFSKKHNRLKNIIYLGPETWGTWNLSTVYQTQFEKSMEALRK